MKDKKYSSKQICEHIEKSKILTKKDGTHPTANEIFNYSPTGELFMLREWFEDACKEIGEIK